MRRTGRGPSEESHSSRPARVCDLASHRNKARVGKFWTQRAPRLSLPPRSLVAPRSLPPLGRGAFCGLCSVQCRICPLEIGTFRAGTWLIYCNCPVARRCISAALTRLGHRQGGCDEHSIRAFHLRHSRGWGGASRSRRDRRNHPAYGPGVRRVELSL
jgi:hypothetical protein